MGTGYIDMRLLLRALTSADFAAMCEIERAEPDALVNRHALY